MRFLLLTFLLSVTVLAGAQNLRSGGRLKTEQAIMDIRHYSVTLDVDPVKEFIAGSAEIRLVLVTRAPELILDLWHEMTVSQVWVNGAKESFVQTQDDLLKIRGVIPFEKGKVNVKVAYSGKPGQDLFSLQGPSQ